MRLEIGRYALRIYPDRIDEVRDIVFIEEVLGLKKDGDSVTLKRENAMGLSCIAYLVTENKEEK